MLWEGFKEFGWVLNLEVQRADDSKATSEGIKFAQMRKSGIESRIGKGFIYKGWITTSQRRGVSSSFLGWNASPGVQDGCFLTPIIKLV